MKKGFTIAEVLVTLGIIGIVAAMTLPGLMARHRSKVLEAEFHKRYNEVSQALLMIKRDEMPIYGNYYGAQIQPLLSARFKGAIGENIYSIASVEQKKRIGYELPVYKTFNKMADFSKLKLDDGAVFVSKEFFIFLNTDNDRTTSIQFVIDINGLKKPNIVGYDVFVFALDKSDTLIPVSQDKGLCDKTSSSILNGWSCSYFAMTETDYFKNLNW